MAGFISTVRFLVKEGYVDEFIRMHYSPDGINQKGIGIEQYMTQTGDRTFTWIGLFESEDQIAGLRSHLVGELDKLRDLLEEISSELGLTDPSFAPVIWTNLRSYI